MQFVVLSPNYLGVISEFLGAHYLPVISEFMPNSAQAQVPIHFPLKDSMYCVQVQ